MQRICHKRAEDAERTATDLRVSSCYVRKGTAAGEVRDRNLKDQLKGRDATCEDAQAELPLTPAKQPIEPKTGPDQGHLLLDQERHEQESQEPHRPPPFQEVEGETQRHDRESDLVKVVEVDVRQRQEE